MAVINILDHNTVDQIAAGEVVERPASVVKELVENAIDAGASCITVEVKEGGLSLIRVTDNGSGIEKEQIQKAFLRHATSKIISVADLLTISSLGFRGEALSSIGAVAQVELITKTADALTGIRYVQEGGTEKQLEEIGAPTGTTILVKNLFYNVPARRKFLKTPATEGGYISDLMEHLALSRPDISFQYIQNGHSKFHTSGNGDLKEIIYRIFGRDIAAQLIPIQIGMEGLSVSGFLGKPLITRANRNFEIFFVNQRYIKSDMLAKGVEEGYKSYLMQHKFPFSILHFTVDSMRLDVNVHPTKMDIRFQNQMALYDFLVKSVNAVLKEQEMIQTISLTKGEPQEIDSSVDRLPEPFEVKRNEQIQAETVAEEPVYQAKMQEDLHKSSFHKVIGTTSRQEPIKNDNIHANILKQKDHIFVEKAEQMDFFDNKILTQTARKDYKILGQIFDTYWLITYEDKLLIVDQHAAHEKVKYEKIVKQFGKKEIHSQSINPPVIVTLSGKEESAMVEYKEQFRAMGFEIESFGGNEYALRAVPTDLYGCNEKQMFLEIMDELSESNGIKGTPETVYGKLASMSCKAAVKGNQKMNFMEMESLIDQLLELENPYHCPHGRPTIISMSKYEIEKKFKRIL